MRRALGLGLLILLSCQRAPSWLSEAPLVGFRYRDDQGQMGYLPQAPKRVAVLSPTALGLWKSANLPVTLIGCVGAEEDYRRFYLPCDNLYLLQEALYKARAEWIWVGKDFSWPDSAKAPAPLFRLDPKTPEDWLARLRLLGEVYDAPLVVRQADSLRQAIATTKQNLAEARRFRVLVLAPGPSLALLTSTHPLGNLIQQAGGQTLTAESPLLEVDVAQKALQLEPEVIIVPQEGVDRINDLLTLAPQLYNAPALRYKRIFSMEHHLLEEPMAKPVETFYQLVRILHPEVVGQSPSPVEEAAESPKD